MVFCLDAITTKSVKRRQCKAIAILFATSFFLASEAARTVAHAQQFKLNRNTQPQFSYNGSEKIWFATTRLNENNSILKPVFAAKRHLDFGLGSLEYGTADVSKPLMNGTLATSGNWSNFHTLMTGTDAGYLAGGVRLQMQNDSNFIETVSRFDGTIMIFAHGYDESFNKSLQNTALIASEFEGQMPGQAVLPITFSWPSFDSIKDYAADEANLEWSKKSFTTFVSRILVAKKAETKLVIVAHSMGCRLVFDLLKLPEIYKRPLIDKIILSSADCDYYQALADIPELEQMVKDKIYVLVSDRDGPLLTSQTLHKMLRLGKPTETNTSDTGLVSKLSDVTSNPLLKSLINNASTVLLPVQNAQNPELSSWLRATPNLSQELGLKSEFYDVSDLANFQSELGHRLCWPVIARLLTPTESLSPLSVEIIHKMPERNYIEQTGGRPRVLYRFHKVRTNRFGQN